MQSNTSGGAVYDGLVIEDNEVHTWLQLTADAADSSLTPGVMTAVDVALTQTSADVAASCALPDGIPTAYDATDGTMSPLDGSLVSGVDQSTFTAGSMDGLHAAFVAVDAELLAVAIDIDASVTDLSVTTSSTPEQAAPNDEIIFTALVENLGVSDAPGAAFDFPIPTSASACTWTCASSSGGVCAGSGADGIADSFDLPAGADLTYEMTCTYTPASDTLKSRGCGCRWADSAPRRCGKRPRHRHAGGCIPAAPSRNCRRRSSRPSGPPRRRSPHPECGFEQAVVNLLRRQAEVDEIRQEVELRVYLVSTCSTTCLMQNASV